MPNWKLVIVSGSDASLNSLIVNNNIVARSFSGSFSGSFRGNGAGLTGVVASASPAGPNTSVQFNNSGTTSGSSAFTFNKLTGGVTATSFTGSFKGDGTNLTGLVKSFGITIDGGGSAITTGIKGDITIPFAGTISAWYLTADVAGSIVIDVWKDTFANFPPTVLDTIAGSEKPTLSGVNKNSDTNLTTWTTSVASGDVVRFNVDSAATVTRVNLTIKMVT